MSADFIYLCASMVKRQDGDCSVRMDGLDVPSSTNTQNMIMICGGRDCCGSTGLVRRINDMRSRGFPAVRSNSWLADLNFFVFPRDEEDGNSVVLLGVKRDFKKGV